MICFMFAQVQLFEQILNHYVLFYEDNNKLITIDMINEVNQWEPLYLSLKSWWLVGQQVSESISHWVREQTLTHSMSFIQQKT